jgi:hypothetical protein
MASRVTTSTLHHDSVQDWERGVGGTSPLLPCAIRSQRHFDGLYTWYCNTPWLECLLALWRESCGPGGLFCS